MNDLEKSTRQLKAAYDEIVSGFLSKPENVVKTLIARKAILEDLKRRALENDQTVRPLHPKDEHRWHKPQDNYYSGSGVMACPVCKTGKLSYSRASYNGHVHGSCSTDGCVRWME